MVIYPGGGYNILAWDLEGTEVAKWLNSFGVTAIVLSTEYLAVRTVKTRAVAGRPTP